MLFTVISLGIAAICNPIRVIRQIWPYVVVLGSFAGFVLWNGSVVLGKSIKPCNQLHLALTRNLQATNLTTLLPFTLPSYSTSGPSSPSSPGHFCFLVSYDRSKSPRTSSLAQHLPHQRRHLRQTSPFSFAQLLASSTTASSGHTISSALPSPRSSWSSTTPLSIHSP